MNIEEVRNGARTLANTIRVSPHAEGVSMIKEAGTAFAGMLEDTDDLDSAAAALYVVGLTLAEAAHELRNNPQKRDTSAITASYGMSMIYAAHILLN